mmetsp:Transcript_83910/g.201266  ORF Transcript_83910/g.201266 Transcript_83910/m.201266 type:complete len:200 (+) Transcript_83910:1250-1849(+)
MVETVDLARNPNALTAPIHHNRVILEVRDLKSMKSAWAIACKFFGNYYSMGGVPHITAQLVDAIIALIRDAELHQCLTGCSEDQAGLRTLHLLIQRVAEKLDGDTVLQNGTALGILQVVRDQGLCHVLHAAQPNLRYAVQLRMKSPKQRIQRARGSRCLVSHIARVADVYIFHLNSNSLGGVASLRHSMGKQSAGPVTA